MMIMFLVKGNNLKNIELHIFKMLTCFQPRFQSPFPQMKNWETLENLVFYNVGSKIYNT